MDQRIADQHIGQVHDHQGTHIDAGAVVAIPVAAEGEVQANGEDRQHPPLEVGGADAQYLGIA
ncbi:hypothetical protein D3C80_2165190 [compost metagenome]